MFTSKPFVFIWGFGVACENVPQKDFGLKNSYAVILSTKDVEKTNKNRIALKMRKKEISKGDYAFLLDMDER